MPTDKYSQENIIAMQQDAIKRVRDMQRRAQQSVAASNGWSASSQSDRRKAPQQSGEQSRNEPTRTAHAQRSQLNPQRHHKPPPTPSKQANKTPYLGLGDLFHNIFGSIAGGTSNNNLIVLIVMAVIFSEVWQKGEFDDDSTYLLLALGYLLL